MEYTIIINYIYKWLYATHTLSSPLSLTNPMCSLSLCAIIVLNRSDAFAICFLLSPLLQNVISLEFVSQGAFSYPSKTRSDYLRGTAQS